MEQAKRAHAETHYGREHMQRPTTGRELPTTGRKRKHMQRPTTAERQSIARKLMAGATTRTRIGVSSYPRPTPELEDRMIEWWASHELLYNKNIADFHNKDQKDQLMTEACIQFGIESEYRLLFYIE